MTLAVGKGAFIGIGSASGTWGDVETRSGYLEIDDSSDSLAGEVETLESKSIYDWTTLNTSTAKGNVRSQGTVSHELRFGGVWQRLLAYLMYDTGSVTGSNPYTWTFEDAADLTDLSGESGITMEIFRGNVGAGGGGANESFLYSGGVVRGVTFNFARGEAVRAEWDLLFSHQSMASKSSESFSSSSIVWNPSPNASPTAFLTWNSLTPLIRSGSVSIRRAYDEDRYPIEDRNMAQPYGNGELEIMADFELDYEDSTFWDDFQAATGRDLVLVCDGSNSSNEKITWTLRNCIMKGEPSVSDRGPVRASYSWKAYHDSSDRALTMEIINADSALV